MTPGEKSPAEMGMTVNTMQHRSPSPTDVPREPGASYNPSPPHQSPPQTTAEEG